MGEKRCGARVPRPHVEPRRARRKGRSCNGSSTIISPKILGRLHRLCTGGAEEKAMTDLMMRHRIRAGCALFAAAGILALANCNRIDPLSHRFNSAETAALTDSIVGEDARVVCVTGPRAPSCNPWNADVYVTDLQDPMDFEARWKDDSTVTVTIASGKIRRASQRSRDGRIAIQVTRGPREPLLILTRTPDGKVGTAVLPWPPAGNASR